MSEKPHTPEKDDDLSRSAKDQTGKGGAGESGGGAYPNPHTGKQERGGTDTPFEGGQSENRYFGPKDAASNSAKDADRKTLASDEDDDGDGTGAGE